jgi:outer membrane protein
MAWLAAGLLLGLLPQLRAQTLTLDKALETAFRNSPSIQEAAYRLEISERNLKAEQAGLKSQLNLTITPISLSQTRTFSELTGRYNIQNLNMSEARFSITQPINSLTFRLTQPLFTYNRISLRIKELELALENSRLNYAIQKLSIERQVTQQFLDLFASRESVKIAEEELKNATESYQIIESKVKAGISAPEELYQADLTRLNSQASLETKQIQYENALDNFKILLGLSLSEEIEVVADIRKHIVSVDIQKAMDHALAHRMELRQRDIAIQNALADVVRAGAENEFKASVDLSLGLTGVNEDFGNIYESSNTDKRVAISLNIPLWDWGQKQHLLAASQAQVETERLSAQEETKQIQYEIRQAYRNLQNQERQIEIAEVNIKNAQLTYEINLERYKNGDLSSKDMQFYQLQLSQQKLQELEALISYKMALLDIKIRSLYDFETNEALLDIL